MNIKINGGDWNKMTVKELKAGCKRLNIKGYSNKRKQEIINIIEKHQQKDNSILSIQPDDGVDGLFYKKSKRQYNDYINKLRENAILTIFGADKINMDQRLYGLKKQFENIFRNHTPEHVAYDNFVLERKGGRRYNYDFIVHVQQKMFTQYSFKFEFKYGKSIFEYPQFISLYVKSFPLVKYPEHNYIRFWHQKHLNQYILCAQINEKISSYDEYVRTINSTTYTTNTQKQLYNIMKNDPRTKNKLYAIADWSIRQYICALRLEDIDFDMIEKMIHKQNDKIFIFCSNGVMSCYSFDKIILDRKRWKRNKNTIFFFDTENRFVIVFLLRWKNYKGVCGPAWQVSIKKMI